jgi:hypothetical protein
MERAVATQRLKPPVRLFLVTLLAVLVSGVLLVRTTTITRIEIIDNATGAAQIEHCRDTRSRQHVSDDKMNEGFFQHPTALIQVVEDDTETLEIRIPLMLHQIVPPDSSRYESYISSWEHISIENDNKTVRIHWKDRFLYTDNDLPKIIRKLNSAKLWNGWKNFGVLIEKVDFARYALMYLNGGVYADADQELVDLAGLIHLITFEARMNFSPRAGEDNDGIILLPFESGGPWNFQQVGQALMISTRPHQRYWWDLMQYAVDNYNASCSVLQNTGPMMMTNFWNDRLIKGRPSHEDDSFRSYLSNPIYQNVRLSKRLDGGMDGEASTQAITKHNMGGTWINNNNDSGSGQGHSEQLQACRHRIPWSCRFCQQDSERTVVTVAK